MAFYKSLNQVCPRCGSHLDAGDVVICAPMSSKIVSCGQCFTNKDIEDDGCTYLSGEEWLEEFGVRR